MVATLNINKWYQHPFSVCIDFTRKNLWNALVIREVCFSAKIQKIQTLEMPNFLFFDINIDIINELKKVFINKIDVAFAIGEIQNISRTHTIDAIVSPANSFGFMDGGIDRVYMIMFDDIENTVKTFIHNHGITNSVGTKYMPIGSAFIVPIQYLHGHPKVIPYLISAPTMYLPQSIVGTNNVYYAFLGILQLTNNWRRDVTIGVPGLGTGVGDIDAKEHAKQIFQAYSDFRNGTYEYNSDIVVYKNANYFILNKSACPQRDLECNDPENMIDLL